MKGGRARALDGYIVAFGKKEEEFCSTVKQILLTIIHSTYLNNYVVKWKNLNMICSQYKEIIRFKMIGMLIVLILTQCTSDSKYHTAANADEGGQLEHRGLRITEKQSKEKVGTFTSQMCVKC